VTAVRVDGVDDVVVKQRVEAGEHDLPVVTARVRGRRRRAHGDERQETEERSDDQPAHGILLVSVDAGAGRRYG
jgi:hypothetical protein